MKTHFTLPKAVKRSESEALEALLNKHAVDIARMEERNRRPMPETANKKEDGLRAYLFL